MESHRAFGLLCFGTLAALCVHSFMEAPKHWGDMPATEYVIENQSSFENQRIYLDGMASDVRETAEATFFRLSPVHPVFGSVTVKAANGSGVREGAAGVNVYGTFRDGMLVAEEVRLAGLPFSAGVLFNAAGFLVFVLVSLEEWRLKKAFPYVEVRSNA